LVDVYALEVNQAKKPTQYKLDGQWRDFEITKSKFRVKLFGPCLNMAKEGNIAEVYNARMPKRMEGPDWSKALPGDQSKLIWTEYRDISELRCVIIAVKISLKRWV